MMGRSLRFRVMAVALQWMRGELPRISSQYVRGTWRTAARATESKIAQGWTADAMTAAPLADSMDKTVTDKKIQGDVPTARRREGGHCCSAMADRWAADEGL